MTNEALHRLWILLETPADVIGRAQSRVQPEAKHLVSIGRAPDDGKPVANLGHHNLLAWGRSVYVGQAWISRSKHPESRRAHALLRNFRRGYRRESRQANAGHLYGRALDIQPRFCVPVVSW
jgi:hypothetical protein